jgi:hypothetical protein
MKRRLAPPLRRLRGSLDKRRQSTGDEGHRGRSLPPSSRHRTRDNRRASPTSRLSSCSDRWMCTERDPNPPIIRPRLVLREKSETSFLAFAMLRNVADNSLIRFSFSARNLPPCHAIYRHVPAILEPS